MNSGVTQYVNRMINDASDMLAHFAIDFEPWDLYSMICGGDLNMLDAFSRAAHYMAPGSYHDVVAMPVLLKDQTRPVEIKFAVKLESCQRFPCYLMPKQLAMLTPESKLYDRIEPGIRLAQEWQLTKSLFQRFEPVLNSDQLAFVLPWLKELGRDGVAGMESDEEWRFISKYGLGYMTSTKKKALHAAFTRLGNPNRPTYTPALTSQINRATRLGDKLFAQYRLLKDKPVPTHNGTHLAVLMTETVLPDWYKSDMEIIMNEWQQAEMQRRMERRK